MRKQPRPRHRPFLEILEDRLAPATLLVNSTADTANATDAYLSLREAIAIVNSPALSSLSTQIQHQITGALHAGGSDTIQFDHTQVTTPIILGGTQLELSLPSSTATITLDGGAGITVNGNNASRVFLVDSGVTASLSGLTISHGSVTGASGSGANAQGGGIFNSGTLMVSNCSLTSNSATGGSGAGGLRPVRGSVPSRTMAGRPRPWPSCSAARPSMPAP
jgi:hypothetical protein